MPKWFAPPSGGYSALCAVCNQMTNGTCGHKQPPHGPPPTHIPGPIAPPKPAPVRLECGPCYGKGRRWFQKCSYCGGKGWVMTK